MIFDKEEAKEIVYRVITTRLSEGIHQAFHDVVISSVDEQTEDGVVYWMAHLRKDGDSIGTMSIKRSDVIDYIRENKLKELGI